ncbi:MAG: hypothetical protein HY829_03880, partial [Actinobacteria bacterium]|nr:hypothetical protein [Actinomycetota bacterium]
PGVTAATFTDEIVTGLPRCTGDVTLAAGLSTSEHGRVVGAVYDVLRGRGVKEVEFTTRFALGTGTLSVTSGFPTAEQAARVLEIAGSSQADPVEIAYSKPELLATLHAPLSTATPGASLRQGLTLLRTRPPAGFSELDWYLGDDVLVAPTLTADQVALLDRLTSWFDAHPVVTSYSLRIQAGVQTWRLVTAQEVPDVVRDFGTAAGSGSKVLVSGSLAGKPPYLTLP